MIAKIIIMFIMFTILLTGCYFKNQVCSSDFSALVWFVKKDNVCVLNDLTKNQSTNDLKTNLKLLGMADSVIEEELNDPFVTQRLEIMVFESLKYTKTLSALVETHLLSLGWDKGRQGLHIEETNSGADWIQVFTKNRQKVLVHILGRWDGESNPGEQGNFTTRTIIFKFLNCSPNVIFDQRAMLDFNDDKAQHAKFLQLFHESKPLRRELTNNGQKIPACF